MPTLYKVDNNGERTAFGQMAPSVSALGNITGATTVALTNTDQVYTATLTGNVTFTLTPDANATAGDTYTLVLTQDATGSRTATWPSNFKKAGGALTLTVTASAVDVVTMVYDGTNLRETSRALALA